MSDTKVTYKILDFAQLVRQVEDLNEKEVVYEFSNGKEYKNTDSAINSSLYPK